MQQIKFSSETPRGTQEDFCDEETNFGHFDGLCAMLMLMSTAFAEDGKNYYVSDSNATCAKKEVR